MEKLVGSQKTQFDCQYSSYITNDHKLGSFIHSSLSHKFKHWCDWVLCSWYPRADLKVLAKPQGRICLKAHSGCFQILVPYRCGTEVTIFFWLSSQGCSLLIEAACTPCCVVPYMFKANCGNSPHATSLSFLKFILPKGTQALLRAHLIKSNSHKMITLSNFN